MPRERFSIFRHALVLREQQLDSIERVRTSEAPLIKTQRGRRDVLRLETRDNAGEPLTLFIKRNWLSYGHNERMSLLRRGRIVGVCEIEAENLATLQRLGVRVSPCVASGSVTTLLHERFSFIITQAVKGEPFDRWLEANRDSHLRRPVLKELARLVRHIHDQGYALPSLMARHVFVEFDGDAPRLTLIDVDRLPRAMWRWCRRSKDLTILHLSVAARAMGPRERLRFMIDYAGRRRARGLLAATLRRSNFVLLHRKERATMYLQGLDQPIATRLIDQARASRLRLPVRAFATAALIFLVVLSIFLVLHKQNR